MMSRIAQYKAVALWIAITAGCGDDGGSAPGDGSVDATPERDAAPVDAATAACGADGSGSITGTVDGVTVVPMSVWYREIEGLAAVVLEEGSGSCSNGAAEPSKALAILFCDPPVAVGEYTLVREQDFSAEPCPGQKLALAVVEDVDGHDLAESVSGTVTVASTAGCLEGTFSATFNDDAGSTATGSFSATICGQNN